MCNAIHPERAVIWSLLQDVPELAPFAGVLEADHFTHAPYRRWFDVRRQAGDGAEPLTMAVFERAASALGVAIAADERRALGRMLRLVPPPRVRRNAGLFAQALLDRAAGRPVHVEMLIN